MSKVFFFFIIYVKQCNLVLYVAFGLRRYLKFYEGRNAIHLQGQ